MDYLSGSIKDTNGKRLTNLMVQALDSDTEWFEDRNDDILGSTWVKEDGSFKISFGEESYKENILEKNPDLYLIVRNSLGEIIYTSEVRRGVNQKDAKSLTFDIVLDSLEKKVEPLDDPYAQNNQRVMSAFQTIGEAVDLTNNDVARISTLLLRTISDWILYTQDITRLGFDGPQVPRYPWKESHSHKLKWETDARLRSQRMMENSINQPNRRFMQK
jgi:hypothetical protein